MYMLGCRNHAYTSAHIANQPQRHACMCGLDGGKTETPEQQAHYRACTEMDTQICIMRKDAWICDQYHTDK